MKITLEHADLTEPEIIIRGQPESAQVRNLIELLSGKQQKMFFFKNEYEYIFDMSDVSYFETNGSKVIAHIENDIYETRLKLYEIESTGKPRGFIRINKSTVVNINFCLSIAAEFSGNYTLTMKNTGARLTLSRKYAGDFKRFVMEVY